MQKFIKSKEYKIMKQKYEQQYFKLGGSYAWYDGDKITHKTIGSIAEHFKNKKVTITEETENDEGETVQKKKSKTFYQVWSEDPKMKEYTEVTFDCNQKLVKDYQFNLFDGFGNHLRDVTNKRTHSENEKFLAPIFDHIRSLVNFNEEHFIYLLNYFAQLVQQPHILPNICIVFISEEGVGKDMFLELVGNVIGEKYYVNTDKLDSIVGPFNSAVNY